MPDKEGDSAPKRKRGRPKAEPAEEKQRKQVRDRLHYLNEVTDVPFDASQLSFEERRLLVVLADPRARTDRYSIQKVCELANISYDTYRKAMNNKAFLTAQNSVVHASIKQAIMPLVRKGIQFAMGGDFRYWQALMRMGGQIDVKDDQLNPTDITIRFVSSAAPSKGATIVDAEIVEPAAPAEQPKAAGGFTLSIPDTDT